MQDGRFVQFFWEKTPRKTKKKTSNSMQISERGAPPPTLEDLAVDEHLRRQWVLEEVPSSVPWSATVHRLPPLASADLVRERKPMRLYEIGGFRATLEGDLSLDIYEHRDLVRNKVFATDLSSVHYHDETGNLLLLSDESRMIIEFSPQGNVVAYRNLRPGFAGLENRIPQAEGLAMDNAGSVFVVSEPNLFYRFDPQ